MKPLMLKMNAFGSFGKETWIDFRKVEQNLFLVTGDTGAGKSTIFDAIVYALYGEVSSGSSKKEGLDLQSQFSSGDGEPFVELLFLENGKEYKVYRSPRHLRKKQRGEGWTEVSKKTGLTLPDGSIYLEKDIDKKLEDILGLTKAQFMQVAMIAQGEFMELLRSDSDKKRQIFRKLFKTEFYNQLLEKLKEEDYEGAIIRKEIFMIWKNLISQLRFLEDGEELKEKKERLLNSDFIIFKEISDFSERLKLWCLQFEDGLQIKKSEYKLLSKKRDEKRDAFNRGKNLLESYVMVEKLEGELSQLLEYEEIQSNRKKASSDIKKAYEILPFFQNFEKIMSDYEVCEASLKIKERELPGLAESLQETSDTVKRLGEEQKSAIAFFVKVSEEAKKLFDLFKRKDEEKKRLRQLEARAESHCLLLESSKKEAELLSWKEKDRKERVERLPVVEKYILELEQRIEKLNGLRMQIEEIKGIEADLLRLEDRREKEGSSYEKVRNRLLEKEKEYTLKRNKFLDEQAGFLAKEKLREGIACPVCGSLEHPNPCELKEGMEYLNREIIDALYLEVSDLSGKQEEKAKVLEACKIEINEKTILKTTLLKKLERDVEVFADKRSYSSLETLILLLKEEMEGADEKMLGFNREKKSILNSKAELTVLEEKKEKLKKQESDTQESLILIREEISEIRALLRERELPKDYQTEEDIHQFLEVANQKKLKIEMEVAKAEEILEKRREEKKGCELLIEQLKAELPQKEKAWKKAKEDWEESLKLASFNEEEWRQIIDRYSKKDGEILDREVREFEDHMQVIQARLNERRGIISGFQKPDLFKLEEEVTAWEGSLEKTRNEVEVLNGILRTNLAISQNLESGLVRDKEKLEKSYQVQNLYKKLAGKNSGAKMDIETFVQRYYLKRILHSANRRFISMTAGQYEIRIYDEEDAGKGKNRGLDLRVYSHVTEKEREIRTLSGGESFMAALSLALGMSDQIEEKTSAIQLDIMFIDEGFGSLDDHARNQAVKVLKEMAGGEKLIGIISHVNELKQEIEEQLVVTKDNDGSKAVWKK